MKKLLQQISNNKTVNRIMPVLFTLSLMLASMMGMAQTAYITNSGDGTVSVINVARDSVIATINLGGSSPYGVSVSADGNKVYVDGTSTVSVINTAADTAAMIGTLSPTFGITVRPDGTKVYVTNVYDHTVSVINTAADTVSATITVGSDPYGIAVSPDGSKVYVANYLDSTVSVINTATNTVTDTIKVGLYPYGVSVSPDGIKVYVANSGDNTVSVINTATNTVSATISVGNSPLAFGNFISTYKQPLGIASYSIDAPSISLYPNPATNQLTIHPVGWSSNGVNSSSFHNEEVTVLVMNVLGQETSPPTPLQMERGDASIDVSKLAAGMYFLQMKGEGGSVVRKFVKE